MKADTKDLCLSETLELARNQIVDTRRLLDEAIRKHGWEERGKPVSGLLTCGLVTLAYLKEEIVKFEIAQADRKRGQHLKFNPRGIGLDVCPYCFVCGAKERHPGANSYLNNVAAFVASKDDGETIVGWFAGKARLDFRPSEPNWIQLKVGACDAHLENLKALAEATGRYGVIRQADIVEAMTIVTP